MSAGAAAPATLAATDNPGDGSGLRVEALSVTYRGSIHVLDEVSLQVPEGSRVAILGPNGAGKTTTVRAVSGMLGFHGGKAVGGRVTMNGADIVGASSSRTVKEGITQVPEGRQMFPHLTVDENLRLGALTRSRREVAADMEAAIEFFPALADKRRTRAGLLSGGEQQMVALARAIMARPRVFVIDELTLGLSPRIIEDIVERLLEVLAATRASLLLVEQNSKLALDLCTFAYVLDRGRVSLQGTREELLADRRIQESYLGVRRDAEGAVEEKAP
jgi:branched-chain amino acid transport system ATP-binding protein